MIICYFEAFFLIEFITNSGCGIFENVQKIVESSPRKKFVSLFCLLRNFAIPPKTMYNKVKSITLANKRNVQ